MCEDQIYYFHTSNNNFIAVIQSCYQASLEKNVAWLYVLDSVTTVSRQLSESCMLYYYDQHLQVTTTYKFAQNSRPWGKWEFM